MWILVVETDRVNAGKKLGSYEASCYNTLVAVKHPCILPQTVGDQKQLRNGSAEICRGIEISLTLHQTGEVLVNSNKLELRHLQQQLTLEL